MKKSHLSITSPTFDSNGPIPAKYTCDGENISPPLTISSVPDAAVSLALIVDDPDVPRELHPEGSYTHWVLFNIPPSIGDIGEGINVSSIGTPGKNGRGTLDYFGPCPPPQYEPSEHRYVFSIYALDTMLELPAGPIKDKVLSAMEGHIVQEASHVGRYKRKL